MKIFRLDGPNTAEERQTIVNKIHEITAMPTYDLAYAFFEKYYGLHNVFEKILLPTEGNEPQEADCDLLVKACEDYVDKNGGCWGEYSADCIDFFVCAVVGMYSIYSGKYYALKHGN